MVDRYWQFNMTHMAGAGVVVEMAGRTASQQFSNEEVPYMAREPHGLSPHAPKERSYSPPGVGCKSVSKVSGFCIFFTESALMSSDERNPKSTLPMKEEIGWEIFILS